MLSMAMRAFGIRTILVALALSWLCLIAQETQSGDVIPSAPQSESIPIHSLLEGSATNQPAAASRTDTLPKEVRPGVFKFADVTLDEQQRTVSFPAQMNLSRGAMEYFLVTTWGKTHESIFRTDTEPHRIHLAMLLLGAKGAGENSEAVIESFGQFISNPSSAPLPGDKITIDLSWRANGKEMRKSAEEVVFNSKTKSVMPEASWIYNGSLLFDQLFIAERDGSVMSLITDPGALINSVAQGHDDQTIWAANTKVLPPVDTPVEVTIQLKTTLSGD